MYGSPDNVPRAVVLVGNGSRVASVRTELVALARTVSRLTGISNVVSCTETDLKLALDQFAALGVADIHVQPYFLGLVGKLASRLHERARSWERTHAGQRVSIGEPLGDHPLISDAVRDAASRCLLGRQGTLVLVGHGSPEPAWSRSLYIQARRLERLGVFKRVLPTFLAHEEPSLEGTVEGLRGEVAIVPFFLTRGVHTSIEIPQVIARLRPPLAHLQLAPPWADDPRIALAVAARIFNGAHFRLVRGGRCVHVQPLLQPPRRQWT